MHVSRIRAVTSSLWMSSPSTNVFSGGTDIAVSTAFRTPVQKPQCAATMTFMISFSGLAAPGTAPASRREVLRVFHRHEHSLRQTVSCRNIR